jgi:TRAP-type C4-dicarboxylate transport system substrate-binding protein
VIGARAQFSLESFQMNERKKSAARALVICALCLWPLFLAGPAVSTPIKLKFAHTQSPDSPIGRGAQLIRKHVEEQLEGEIKIIVFPVGQLGNARDIKIQVQHGAIDMAVLPLWDFRE